MSSTYYGIGLCIWSLWCFIKVVLRALPLLTCVDLAALLLFFFFDMVVLSIFCFGGSSLLPFPSKYLYLFFYKSGYCKHMNTTTQS